MFQSVPQHSLFVRGSFFLSCLIGGGLIAIFLRGQRLAEVALRKAHAELEVGIAARTAELLDTTQKLKNEIFECKQVEKKIRRNEEILEMTGAMAKVGGWEIRLETKELTWSSGVYRIHEIDLNTPPDIPNAIDFYAPEARPVIT